MIRVSATFERDEAEVSELTGFFASVSIATNFRLGSWQVTYVGQENDQCQHYRFSARTQLDHNKVSCRFASLNKLNSPHFDRSSLFLPSPPPRIRCHLKGFLRLSLVTCPVALFPATSESEKVSFNQINRKTGHRIKYQKIDAETGEEVANEGGACPGSADKPRAHHRSRGARQRSHGYLSRAVYVARTVQASSFS
jgi:hypothetical protein